MAHMVKCLYCCQQFDRDKIPYVSIGRRYAHKECAEEHEENAKKPEVLKKESSDKVASLEDKKAIEHREFFDLIRDTCMGVSIPDWSRLTKDEKNLTEKGYTLSGLRKTFFYYYVVLNKPIPKKFVSLYALTTVYEEACDYYRKMFEINNKNKAAEVTKEIEKVSIDIPKPAMKRIKFFDIGE